MTERLVISAPHTIDIEDRETCSDSCQYMADNGICHLFNEFLAPGKRGLLRCIGCRVAGGEPNYPFGREYREKEQP